MQQNAFVQSMKTIAQSAITKAGFDKTRNGQIVGVNTVTNTYSIKVDGIIYNNVKVVNGMEYNKGDIVKVNIPMNNPSQAYISSSVLSDDSIGSKIATTQRLIDEVNKKADSIIVVMGRVYQLSINISYEPYIDPSDAKQYWRNIYTAVLTQDGTDVTSEYSSGEFDWYLEQPNGNTVIPGSPAKTIQLSTKDYLYGQSVMLEWRHTYTDEETQQQKEMVLRSRVTLFDNGSISNVAKYTTEINSGGVFVHRADGNYDVGADWQSTWAYGVKIADTVDIIKAGQIWGSFGGSYLTIGRTSGNNFNIYANTNSSSGSLQFRYNSTVLTEIKNGSILLGRTAPSYYNVYMDAQHLYFRYGTDILTDITDSSITLGRSTAGYYSTLINSSSINFRYNNNGNNINIASFGNGGITLNDINNRTTFKVQSNNMQLYYYNSSIGNIDILSLNASGMVLKNPSNVPIFRLINSSGQIISQNGTNTGTAGYQSMTTGANGGTYGQPGIAFCKRYSNGGWSEFEMRLNDTQQGAQIYNTNQVSIAGGGSWNTQITAAGNGIFVYGSFYNYSDRRLKKHIRYLDEDECITFIRNLRPALFYRNDTKDVGLYAQDVKDIDEWDVFTEYVKGGIPHVPEDMLTLDYLGLIMPLIKCCQQLDKRIKELEQKE